MRRFLALALIASSTTAFGYIRQVVPGTTTSLYRSDTNAIQFYLNNQVVAGATSSISGMTVISSGSDPVTAARKAAQNWGNIASAGLKFLPIQTTAAFHDSNDGLNVITIAQNSSDMSVLGFSSPASIGAVAITVDFFFTSGRITDSDILLNPYVAFSTDLSTGIDLQGVLTHEIGHCLSADHTGVLGATMYPYSNSGKNALVNQRYPAADDVALVTSSYPATTGSLGTVQGMIVLSGGAPAMHVLYSLIDMNTGATIGGITDGTGAFSQMVPAGNYELLSEPYNAFVQPGNIYSTFGLSTSSGFQTTMLGGFASPTALSVKNGQTTVASTLTLTSGTSSLSLPSGLFEPVGTGAAGVQFPGFGGPMVAVSGQSLDLLLVGGGIDSTTQLYLYGAGATLTSFKQDTSVIFAPPNQALQLMRATINFSNVQSLSLITLVFVKGSNVESFTGIVIVEPPTPQFTKDSLTSAANYSAGASPGAIAVLFSAPNTATLGPVSLVTNPGFDAYKSLPTTLSGVTVYFDGIPAPLFYVAASQVSVQVPFEIAGKTSTTVVVDFYGSRSAGIPINVVPVQPAFFTLGADGKADVIATNQDYSLNIASNPAAKGSVVTIYGTGAGKVSYAIATGQQTPGPPGGFTGGYSCSFAGAAAIPIAFAGWTPSAVGLAQWSFVVPTTVPSGMVSVVCTDATGAKTQSGNIFVQ